MGSTNKNRGASLEALQRINNQEVAEAEKQRMSLVETLKAEKKVTVIGAPMYQAYFGRSMPISINGILVSVPLDGNRYEIPESYAEVFNARVRSVNDQLNMQKALSDVTSNHESYPGEKNLIAQV